MLLESLLFKFYPYGIGKLCLEGRNIRQNKPYFFWKSGVLEQFPRRNR
ncbi:hypothetical protein HMPREF1378_00094 [Enterococcus faecium R496]|uniref:Uncharacterized protein n=1 Tax=Enterococcus faecium R496 TaxID=1134836 RepID=A0AAV3GZF3_ENTFC|nr:hypothetical protein HMPREF1378_00094 [Enterococcus faecium R496]